MYTVYLRALDTGFPVNLPLPAAVALLWVFVALTSPIFALDLLSVDGTADSTRIARCVANFLRIAGSGDIEINRQWK